MRYPLGRGGIRSSRQDFSRIRGANGDMGENDTAGLDPIFFFHHCSSTELAVAAKTRLHRPAGDHSRLPGHQLLRHRPGPHSRIRAQPRLTMDSPLDPFTLIENGTPRPYTSRDCVNIETQLGYAYGPGSLEDQLELAEQPPVPSRTVAVAGGQQGLCPRLLSHLGVWPRRRPAGPSRNRGHSQPLECHELRQLPNPPGGQGIRRRSARERADARWHR